MKKFIEHHKFSIALDAVVVSFFGFQPMNEILYNFLLVILIVVILAMRTNQYFNYESEKIYIRREKQLLKNIESLTKEVISPTLRPEQKASLINEFAILKSKVMKGEDL